MTSATKTKAAKIRKGPSPFVHRGTNQVAVKVKGRFFYFGPANVPANQAHAREFATRYANTGKVERLPPGGADAAKAAAGAVTMADVVALAFEVCEERYGGPKTTEFRLVKDVGETLVSLFGSEPATAFGPVRLSVFQDALVKRGLTRFEVNRRVSVARRLFKIAVGRELLNTPENPERGAQLLAGLKTLEPLRLGHTKAPESPGIAPVSARHVALVLRRLKSQLHEAMVRTHWATGMRSSELLTMKAGEIDRKRKPWVYRPTRHKGTWRGQGREIMLGKRAERVLAPLLLGLKPGDFVFSPRRERERIYAEKRAKRQSKVPPSQVDRRKDHPKRIPGERYTTSSYAHVVARACTDAGIVPAWRPYALRHSFATRIRARYGLEGSAAACGHAQVETTAAVYAERNRQLAERIAREIG